MFCQPFIKITGRAYKGLFILQTFKDIHVKHAVISASARLGESSSRDETGHFTIPQNYTVYYIRKYVISGYRI